MQSTTHRNIDPSKYLILIDNRKQQRLLKPNDNKYPQTYPRNFKWRKIKINLQSLPNFQYYDTIEVGNDTMTKIEDQFQEQSQLDEQQEQEQVFNNNNKQIYTLEDAQKLQPEDIKQMKINKNPNEIIGAIVSNNQQFNKRTAYSKEKYLAKKKKKYMFRFHGQQPTLENVHNFYFNSEPKGIGYIRWDMFGFMLLQGSPYRNVLLAERTKGILLGSLLKRSAHQITVCSDEIKNIKRFPIVQQLNIKKEQYEKILKFTEWSKLIEDITQKQEGNDVHLFTNLMMLGNYNFQQIIQKIQLSLAPGCIICLHCQNIQPLQTVLYFMKSTQIYIHIKLFDMWAREYQVLKNRTHPLMYMAAHSGYLLTAIKI